MEPVSASAPIVGERAPSESQATETCSKTKDLRPEPEPQAEIEAEAE